MEVILWVLITLRADTYLQQSRPMWTREECEQLSSIIELLYTDVETRCVKRIIVK